MNTKKIVAMIIALIMTTAIAGCGNTVDHKDTEVSSTVETTIDKNVEEKSEGKKSETAEKTDATETADKKDSKETSKKTEKPNDNKDADKSDKDKGSVQANSNSSVSKPSNSGNANNNGSASKPSTPATPNKPSGNNSGSNNNGNHNGSVNKPSKPSEPSKPTEKPASPQKPAEKPSEPETPAPHVCSFDIVVSTNSGNCQTASSTVKKCSCGKTTTVNGGFGSHNMVHHDAQGHEVTDYEKHYICNQCGADFGLDADAAGKHTIVTQGCQNYSLKPVPVGSHWEETSPAYDECSICGKR